MAKKDLGHFLRSPLVLSGTCVLVRIYWVLSGALSIPDMSNSIETAIDIDIFGGIDIGIDIDSGYS